MGPGSNMKFMKNYFYILNIIQGVLDRKRLKILDET